MLTGTLVVEPRILLLGEPLSALDPAMWITGRQLLKKLHEELGFTAIHVTRSLPEAPCLATRIAYVEHGVLRGVYEPEELLETV